MLNIINTFFVLFILIFPSKEDIPEDYKCSPLAVKKLKLGDEVVLCIHMKQLKEKVAIRLRVDEYSMFSVEGFYEKYKNYSEALKKKDLNSIDDIELLAQIDNITSNFTSVRIII